MNVRRGYQDPVNKPVYFNRQQAVIVSVEMTDTEDIQKIGAALNEAVGQFELTQPIGITYNFSTFQETNVTTSINSALTNVAQTFAVVLVVMMIFLGFRGALIIACIVPFTVTFALIGMNLMGNRPAADFHRRGDHLARPSCRQTGLSSSRTLKGGSSAACLRKRRRSAPAGSSSFHWLWRRSPPFRRSFRC